MIAGLAPWPTTQPVRPGVSAVSNWSPFLESVLHLYKTGSLQVVDEGWSLRQYGDSGYLWVNHTSGVPTLKIRGRHKHHQWLRENKHPLLDMSRRALVHLWLTDERFWYPEFEIGLFGFAAPWSE